MIDNYYNYFYLNSIYINGTKKKWRRKDNKQQRVDPIVITHAQTRGTIRSSEGKKESRKTFSIYTPSNQPPVAEGGGRSGEGFRSRR